MKKVLSSTVVDVALVLVSAALLLAVSMGITQWRGAAVHVCELPKILVDPGHGGEDGGASAKDGTKEKDINLAIALPLGNLLHVMGYDVSYTRTTDTMVEASGATLRERKVNDIKNRLRCIEQADLAVSIHQNKFSQTKYSGAQMFYAAGHTDSRVLAEAVRSSVVGLLQPENSRELKKGEDSVYLLKHATQPMVLVECGFLSNEQELQKLKTREYQQKMAFAVAGGLFSYMG